MTHRVSILIGCWVLLMVSVVLPWKNYNQGIALWWRIGLMLAMIAVCISQLVIMSEASKKK